MISSTLSQDNLHSQVRLALDEFEVDELDVSARRAYRIARSRGDSEVAHRLMLELSSAMPLKDSLMVAATIHGEEDYETLRTFHDQCVEDHIVMRTPRRARGRADDEPVVFSGSLFEMRLNLEELEQSYEFARSREHWEGLTTLMDPIADRREVMQRIRQWIFSYLVTTETQLASSDAVATTFGRHRLAIDALLDVRVPELRDQLGGALRSAEQGDSESRSHVLLTCRRIIQAVADHCYPASDTAHIGRDGREHDVGQSSTRNRLMAFVETTGDRALNASIEELNARLETLEELVNKGVHEAVSASEMEFALVQSYLLAGEMLSRVSPVTSEIGLRTD